MSNSRQASSFDSPFAIDKGQLLAFIKHLDAHQTSRDRNNASIVYCPGRFTWMSTETPRTAVLEFLRLARTFAETELLPSELREILDGERPIFVMRKADNSAFRFVGDKLKSLDQSFADRALAVVIYGEHTRTAVRLAIQFSGLSLLLFISVAVFVTPLPSRSSNPNFDKLVAATRDFAQWTQWVFMSITLLAVVHAVLVFIIRNRTNRAYFADPSNTLHKGAELP